MTDDGDLAEGTRTAIKFGICLIVVGQILANAYSFYLHPRIVPFPLDPRALALFTPGFIYMMASTKVPDVLKKSAGIRFQAIHFADWSLAFGLWEFVAKTSIGQGALIALLSIGAVIMVVSVKDAIQVQA